MKALFDTNILIDYLNGIENAKIEIELYQHPSISIITWMEVMVGTNDADQGAVESFLTQFDLININQSVAKSAVIIRKKYSMKLHDAIIWASAKLENALLVTRNTKDFPTSSPDVRIPYEV